MLNHGVPAQKLYLFTDLRHILCSDLQWLGPDGQPVPLHPQGPAVLVTPGLNQIPRGLRFVAQPATKTDPLPQNPYWRRRITYDGGTYRAWSAQLREGGAPNEFEICTEESSDGFDWRLVHTARVTLPATGSVESFTVFQDPHAPANERFKAVIGAEPPKDQWPELFDEYKRVNAHHRIWRLSEKFVFALYGLVSSDGRDWRVLPRHLMVNFLDADTSIHFDESLGKYVMYSRLMFQQRRWVGRAESDDFRNWTPLNPILAPQLDWPMTDDIYFNGFSFYPGERAYHLMFPHIYHRATQRSSIHLYSSEDGLAFLKVPGGAVVEPGPEGSFDSEFLASGRDLVPLGPDRIAIPYIGIKYPHKYPRWPGILSHVRMGWATWTAGRLVALRADDDGRFATFPLEVAGRALRLNARIAPGGEIRVGIVGQSGRSVSDCDAITGDGLRLPVSWRGEDKVGIAPTTAITLDFRLRNADLFGFEWV